MSVDCWPFWPTRCPPEAEFLEIGTGVGVGTAWLTEGIGRRTDVNLVTLEMDSRLRRIGRDRDDYRIKIDVRWP
jgi:hypothetical protein